MPETEKKLKRAKEHIENLSILTENKNHIMSFIEQLSAEGLTKIRQIKYLYTLGKIAKMLSKDFSKTDKNDIKKLCSTINNTNYKEWTKHDYKVVLKRFYKWLREEEGQEFDKGQYPNEVKWIPLNMKKERKRLPKEMLTIEEIKNLANQTNNLRDRCLILLLYESGARIGELLNLKIKDIESDEYGAKINLFGKTGERKIRIIASAPSISNWLLEHPKKEDKNSFLFCGIWSKKRGKEIGYQTIRLMLKEASEKAGINKPMNPHHFRHSRATELAKIFTESQLCEYMGWVQGSQEAATYVHLSGRDMDRAVLGMHGLVEAETEKEKFKTIKCPRCNIKNSPGSKFCSGCSLALDEKSVMEFDAQKDQATQMGYADMEMLKDPKFRQFYNDMLLTTIEKYKEIKNGRT
jgi:site-specific recombinase XerD/phage FluMu protein Com